MIPINQEKITIETRNELVGYCNTYSSHIEDCQKAYLLITNGTLYIDNIFEIYRNTIFNIAETFEKNGLIFWDDSYHILKITIIRILSDKLDEANIILYNLMVKFLKMPKIYHAFNYYKTYLNKYQKEINEYKKLCIFLRNFSLKKELESILYEISLDSYSHNKTRNKKEDTKEYRELLSKLGLSEDFEKVLSNKKLILTKK